MLCYENIYITNPLSEKYHLAYYTNSHSLKFDFEEGFALIIRHVIECQIAKYLESYSDSSGKPYSVSASVGIYRAAPEETGDFKEILKKSDKLMYMDKENKKRNK